MPDNFDADAMMAFIGQLGKEVDNLKTKITSLNEVGGKGMGNLANETERFGKVIQQYTSGPLKAMDAAAAGLAKTLVGAGGLALSFAGVAKSLDMFAVGELRIKNFATNTGFSVESVKNLRVQLAAAGIDANEASSGIGSIGAKLQEVLALQETSSFYRSLQASSPALAEQVRQLMNAGKQQEALNVLQEAYNKGGERFKAWLPTVTGYSKAAYEAGIVGMKGLIEPWKFNDDKAKEYHKNMTNLETISTSLWTDMSYTMLEGISKMMGVDGIDGLNKKAHDFATGFKSFFNTYVMPTLQTTVQEFQGVVNAFVAVDKFFTKWSGIKKEGEQQDEKDKPLGLRTERAIIEDMNKQLPGGPEGGTAPSKIWEWFKNQFSMEAGAAEAKPDGTLLVQEEETKKETNKSVRDMRDIMQKWDQKGADGTGGMGGRAGGAGFAGAGVPGGGAAVGGPQGPMGRSGPGQSYPESKSKSPDSPAETTGDLGEGLAEQRAAFKKELDADPELKKLVIGAMSKEGGIQSNLEQLMNMAAMRKQTLRQALYSGQYGPVTGRNRFSTAALIAAGVQAGKEGEAALEKVYAGSNITDYATDQGMRGDPNFDKYMANPQYWGMHKVEGAWFSAHGEPGRRWAAKMREADKQRAAAARTGTGVWSGSGKAIPFLPGGGMASFDERFGDWTKRTAIDNALRTAAGRNANLGTAKVDIEFSGDKDKKDVWTKGASPFIPTNISRSPQAPVAGGGVAAFNTYSFE